MDKALPKRVFCLHRHLALLIVMAMPAGVGMGCFCPLVAGGVTRPSICTAFEPPRHDSPERYIGGWRPLDRSGAISTLGPGDSGRVNPKEKFMRISLAKGISAVVVSIVMVGTSLAGDAVQSGLKVGESVNPFLVDDITGPNKGTTLCYR